MLAFQRLDVYRCSVEFLALAYELHGEVQRGNAGILDQLKRAATSVSLNVAEGAGRSSSADKARTFAIARGSATECAAVLDALLVMKAIDANQHRRGTDLLERIVSMLTKMCR